MSDLRELRILVLEAFYGTRTEDVDLALLPM